jgi:type IV pilus assembly protein PilM
MEREMALTLPRRRGAASASASPRHTSVSSRHPCGLDIDGDFLAAAVNAKGHIQRVVSADLDPGLVTDGEIEDVGELAETIKSFFKDQGLPRRVRLGLSNQQIVVRHLDLPPFENLRDLEAAVRFQAAEAIPMPLEEAVLDWQLVPRGAPDPGGPSDDGPTMVRVIVVAARSSMIDRVVDVARRAGLRPEGIDLNAFALIRALSDPGVPDDAAKVYCHLAGTTNLAIAQASACLFTRPLATNWAEEGEHVGLALAEEIRLSIDYSMSLADAPSVTEVLLSGPGATREGLAGDLATNLGVPVTGADPLGGRSVEQLGNEDPYRHSVAVGLALGAVA